MLDLIHYYGGSSVLNRQIIYKQVALSALIRCQTTVSALHKSKAQDRLGLWANLCHARRPIPKCIDLACPFAPQGYSFRVIKIQLSGFKIVMIEDFQTDCLCKCFSVFQVTRYLHGNKQGELPFFSLFSYLCS